MYACDLHGLVFVKLNYPIKLRLILSVVLKQADFVSDKRGLSPLRWHTHTHKNALINPFRLSVLRNLQRQSTCLSHCFFCVGKWHKQWQLSLRPFPCLQESALFEEASIYLLLLCVVLQCKIQRTIEHYALDQRVKQNPKLCAVYLLRS